MRDGSGAHGHALEGGSFARTLGSIVASGASLLSAFALVGACRRAPTARGLTARRQGQAAVEVFLDVLDDCAELGSRERSVPATGGLAGPRRVGSAGRPEGWPTTRRRAVRRRR